MLVERILVETNLFEHTQIGPDFINPCCFGEDFAAWLRKEILGFPDLSMELSEPIQEDYGWGLWASQGKDRFWIAISYGGKKRIETPARWVISIANDPGFNLSKHLFRKPDRRALERLRGRVRQVLASNDAIRVAKE